MKLNNAASKRAFLEQIPTQELDEMLQAELRKDNIDDDLVRLILDVLEEREADHPIENDEEITAAVEKFTAYVDGLKATPAKPTRKWNAVLKVASVLLVVGLLFCIVPQAANAESFFEVLARWTECVFEFFRPSGDRDQPEYVFETDNQDLQKIYDAVVEMGVTDPVVPMWVPDGYELHNFRSIKQSIDKTVSAELAMEDKYIFFSVIVHDKEVPFTHEKDIGNITTLELGSVQHYIISNLEEYIVAWATDNVECSLVTNCSKEELYNVLESTYTTEE